MKAGDVIPGRRPALSIEWNVSFIVEACHPRPYQPLPWSLASTSRGGRVVWSNTRRRPQPGLSQ